MNNSSEKKVVEYRSVESWERDYLPKIYEERVRERTTNEHTAGQIFARQTVREVLQEVSQ